MKIKIKKVIGTAELEFDIEHDKDREALAMAGFLAEIPTKCGTCGDENVKFTSNRADGFIFVKVKCNHCLASANMGEYKEGGFFWHQFVKYEPKDTKARSDK